MWMGSRFKPFWKSYGDHSIVQCLNCQHEFHPQDNYCPQCGQRRHESNVSVWGLFSEFFVNIFNVDNSFYRSLTKVWVPGYLSKDFMAGRRKKYVNPIRFFLVTMFLHFFLLNYTIDLEGVGHFSQSQVSETELSKYVNRFDEWKESSGYSQLDTSQVDSLRSIIFGDQRSLPQDSLNFTLMFSEEYDFSREDVYQTPADSLFKKYNIESISERMFIGAWVRAMRDMRGAITYALGNLLWSIVLTILLVGFVMKVLYIRRRRYYVEHLVVLFNIHTFAFIIISILIALGKWVLPVEVNDVFRWGYPLSGIFFFLSMKQYYAQGYFKTFVKFLITIFFYFIILLAMVMIVLLISLLLFK